MPLRAPVIGGGASDVDASIWCAAFGSLGMEQVDFFGNL